MHRLPIGLPPWIILAIVLGPLGVALLLPLFVRPGKRPPDKDWSGVFYSNPEDPSLFVPKRHGIGYTINFGNPWGWVVLALIILMVALPLVLGGVMMHALHR